MGYDLTLDPGSWYQVNISSFPNFSFYGDWFANETGTPGTATIFMNWTDTTNLGQQWQFVPVKSSYYLIRCNLAGPDFYLGVSETTSPSLMYAGLIEEQNNTSVEWQIKGWGDGYYYLTNAANGTYRLSTTNGATLIMNADVSEGDNVKFQFGKKAGIRGASYTYASIPGLNISWSSWGTTTGSSSSGSTTGSSSAAAATGTQSTSASGGSSNLGTSSESQSSSSGLSPGAAAGIAIAGMVAVVAALLGVWFLVRRRRRGTREVGLGRQELPGNPEKDHHGVWHSSPQQPYGAPGSWQGSTQYSPAPTPASQGAYSGYDATAHTQPAQRYELRNHPAELPESGHNGELPG